MTEQRRAATEEEARAVASPLRLRILRLCLDQPMTNKEIADALGRDPASVLHHVRKLVATGFLAAEPPRRGARGSRELPYRATGKSWVLDVVEPELDRAKRTAMIQAFVEDTRRIGPENVDTTRLGLRLTPDEHRELTDRLAALVEDFRRRRSDGEPWSLFVGLHPDDRPVRPAKPGAAGDAP